MTNGPNSLVARLESILAPHVISLGYELLDVEYQTKGESGGPVLRLFIENPSGNPIKFEDCVAVDNGLDTFLASAEFEEVLSSAFTLEVSSPGLDRPLKKLADFQKFEGKKANIKTYRPLTLEEMANTVYFEHHQKQKNFSGIIRGITNSSVKLETDNQVFEIPHSQITKANLDVSALLNANNNDE